MGVRPNDDEACYWHRKQHDYLLPQWNLPKKDSINIYDEIQAYDSLRHPTGKLDLPNYATG